MYLNYNEKDLDNYYVVDIEADDLNATVVWCASVVRVSDAKVWEFHGDNWYQAFRDFVADRPTAIWLGHNIVSFDAPTLSRLVGADLPIERLVDTLILSQLYHPHMPGGHSLGAWGERLRFPKGDFHDWTKFSAEMLEYCTNDSKLCRKIFLALTKRMKARGFSELSCSIEHRIRAIIDIQEANGFRLDVRAAELLLADLRSREEAVVERLQDLFPPKLTPICEYKYRVKDDGTPYASYLRHAKQFARIEHYGDTYVVYDYVPFNLGSPKQRVERLLGLGWKPTRFTPKGSPKIDEDAIVEFSESSGLPEVRALADFLVYNGRANMVQTWLNAVGPDGKIHGTVWTCGAGSRRMRHTDPNTANIPGSGAKFGHECRSLWTCNDDPDHVLLGVDAKGIEGRIFVHYLNDEDAYDFFIAGDPHQGNADAISKAVGFKVERGPTKGLFYARLYGASNSKLGSMLGGKAPLGKLIRGAIDGNIPGFERLVSEVTREYESQNGFLRTIDGGFVRCPSPHAALNYKFQSAGAIVMKLASIIMHAKAGHLRYQKVGDIHDEWQFSVHKDDAEELAKLACDSITEAGEQLEIRVKLEGDYKIGRTWAETH